MQENKELNEEYGTSGRIRGINYDFSKNKGSGVSGDKSKIYDDLSSDEEESEVKSEVRSRLNNSSKNKTSKFKSNEIKRPIICICNNLYAKSISLLRKEAFVFNIKKVDEKKP